MKRFITVLLTVCLLVSLGTTMTACTSFVSGLLDGLHECEFSDEWTSDESSHWHACADDTCEEISDKGDHTWDEGVITTEPTQEADGACTFTCTVCEYTRTEAVVFTGLSKEAWEAAFVDSVFENFTYTESATTSGSGISMDAETIYKFTKDNAWAQMTVAGQTQESLAPDKESAIDLRDQLVDSIISLTPYDSYEYDAATKTYKATKELTVAALNAATSDITLKFEDGKLVEIKYTIEFTQSGVALSAISTIKLTDYGSTTVPSQA